MTPFFHEQLGISHWVSVLENISTVYWNWKFILEIMAVAELLYWKADQKTMATKQMNCPISTFWRVMRT